MASSAGPAAEEQQMTQHARLKLGLAAPVFAAPGIPMMRTPSLERASWPTVRETVLAAERLGFDSVWFSDHLFHGLDGEFHESWSALSMAAGFTERIRLVTNHLGNGLRDARVLAKMATTVADATGGRLELFLARGYREREYTSYGLAWDDEATRTRRLAEAVGVIRAMWGGEPVDFEGEFYRLSGAVAAPSHPSPPFIWLGGPLDATNIALIAAKADGWNALPMAPEAYAAAARAIDEACAAIGRDPGSLRRSMETQVLVLDGWENWANWLDRWRSLRERAPLGFATSDMVLSSASLEDAAVTEVCRTEFMVGTRDEVRARIQSYRASGLDEMVCWFMDSPALGSMEALAALRADLSE
jgi:alkanesulfonate monooxygenase SsuD/methylene tetrahydromethanopterin reductase-like flavin-dependent oxidoreductase (luciferase family)